MEKNEKMKKNEKTHEKKKMEKTKKNNVKKNEETLEKMEKHVKKIDKQKWIFHAPKLHHVLISGSRLHDPFPP